MFKGFIGAIWRRVPARIRRWSMRVTHTRFTVTAGAVIFNDKGEVLLLKHLFRVGSGWGLPGGFLEVDEQPIDAVRRELHEEVGLELDDVEVFAARSFRRPRQVEVIFRGRANGAVAPRSMEVERAEWFAMSALPDGLPKDQRLIVERAASDGAKQWV